MRGLFILVSANQCTESMLESMTDNKNCSDTNERRKRLEFTDTKHRRRVEQRLREAVFVFGSSDWKSVAHYVGGDATPFGCMWHHCVHMRNEQYPQVEMSESRARAILRAYTRSTYHTFTWNKALDAKLCRLVEKYVQRKQKVNYAHIAMLIGGGVTASQCKMRWRDHVDPALAEYRTDAWSTEEISRLQLLHELQVPLPGICKQLKRSYMSCRAMLHRLAKKPAAKMNAAKMKAAKQNIKKGIVLVAKGERTVPQA